MYEEIKELHALVLQITPFCRAGSNPQVAPKLEEIERLFLKLETEAKMREAQLNTLVGELPKIFCCKCGKDITHEKQIGAGDGTGNLFQCESCYKKKKQRGGK